MDIQRLSAVLALLTGLAIPSIAWARSSPCEGRGTSVVVDLDRSRLWLCDEGEGVRSYGVSLGQKGVGKRKQGDKKTPVGTYSLAQGRASNAGFHRILDVGYPTSAQKKAGYTGSAIGIHGPKDGFAWLGPVALLWDWTAGCIAVSSRRQIESIEDWVRGENVRKIHLVQSRGK